MQDDFVTVNGQRVSTVRLRVGGGGPWYAECEFEQDPQLSGRVTLKIGTLQCVGTIAPESDGTFGLQRRCRIVAGAGGWGKPVAALAYHSDIGRRLPETVLDDTGTFGVKAHRVALEAAAEVGETIGTFLPAREKLGSDYVRQASAASRALQDAAGQGVMWWVDFDGMTNVGPRTSAPIDKSKCEVLAYDPMQRMLTLAVDDPAAIAIGSIVSDRLDEAQTVREYEVCIEKGNSLRVYAWTGGTGTEEGRLPALLRAIAERANAGKLFGKYRYRVIRMKSDGRVDLQAVRRGVGLPDLGPISMWPGVAGVHAELTPAAEVLVEFVEGDRTRPIVTHFSGKDGVGFVPVELVLLGGTQAVARQGDLVQCGGPGTQVVFSDGGITPSPLLTLTPYLVSFSALPTDVGPLQRPLFGAISTGNTKIKA